MSAIISPSVQLMFRLCWSPATYILCAVLLFIWITPDLWKMRGLRKNYQDKKKYFQSFKILVKVKSTIGATEQMEESNVVNCS